MWLDKYRNEVVRGGGLGRKEGRTLLPTLVVLCHDSSIMFFFFIYLNFNSDGHKDWFILYPGENGSVLRRRVKTFARVVEFFFCSRLVDTRSDVSWVWCTVNNGLLDDQTRLLIFFVYSFSSFYFHGACARLISMSVNLESSGSFQIWWIRKSPNPFKLNKVHAKICSGVFSFSCFCMDFYSIGLRDDIDGVGISASISTDITYMAVVYYKFFIMVYLS